MTALAEWYSTQSREQKIEAARRFAALAQADALARSGFPLFNADINAAHQAGCHWRTIQRWRSRLGGVRLDDPAALHWLCPRRNPARRTQANRGERK